MYSAPAELLKTQLAFTGHLRDPRRPPPPGVPDRRLQVYRELVFNNVDGLLSGVFPVLRELLGDEPWQQLVRGFFIDHRSHTPYFPELSREFLNYLESADQTVQPLWLRELAHYEWVELAISVADPAMPRADVAGDLLTGEPLLSPLAWPLRYQYPVQRIGPDYQPEEPPAQQTFLLVHRDPRDKVHFQEINALTWALLAGLRGEDPQFAGLAGGELLEKLAGLVPQLTVQQVRDGGLQTLEQLREAGVILGVRRGPGVS